MAVDISYFGYSSKSDDSDYKETSFIFKYCDELKYACGSVTKAYDGLLKFVELVTSYVVCPSCNCIYDYDQCYEARHGNKYHRNQ